MKSILKALLVTVPVLLHWSSAMGQQLTLRPNDTTSMHLMVEPMNTSFGAFYGFEAGRMNIGSNNTLLGYRAGAENRVGMSNTFVGELTGEHNLTGHSNTYIGRATGRFSYGNENTFLGVDAGSFSGAGMRNTFIGTFAGTGSTGSDNVFLGRQAGTGVTGSHKLFIENTPADSTAALLYGEFDNNYLRANGRIDVYSTNTSFAGVKSVISYSPGSNFDVPGILGENTVDDYYGIGVKGVGGYMGVHGLAIGTGTGYYFGTYGGSLGTNSGTNYGLYGEAYSANQNIGVYGVASGGSSSYAGYFEGNSYISGNVGIGILDPSTKLHVYSANNPTIKLQSDGTSEISGRIAMRQSDDTGMDMYYDGITDVLAVEPFNSGVGGGKKLTMNLSGNIGIGKSPVGFPLAIKGDASNGFIQFFNNADVAKWHLRLESNGAFGITESGVVDRRLVIAPGGNIGIGTTNTPSASLHIFSGTEPTIKLQSDGISENSGRVSLRQSNNTGADLFYDGALDVIVLETFNAGVSDGRRMIMQQTTGDMGIGTTDLATGHKLSVNGKIACTEVRVQPQNQWPDYVFAEEYALKPLEQLKQEIEIHGHLPGIPSAQEIQTNGLQIGDMQSRMMEKIEELTLYLIDINSQVADLKKVIEIQSKEIEALKKAGK